MPSFKTDIKMGDLYKDTVSGYEGKATAVYFYLHGCERVSLEMWDANQAKLLSETFDAPRLEHVSTRLMARATRTGGYKDAPPDRGGPR